jgi:hypothetical protein
VVVHERPGKAVCTGIKANLPKQVYKGIQSRLMGSDHGKYMISDRIVLIPVPYPPKSGCSSTRRLRARPSKVSLEAAGRVSPNPMVRILSGAIPCRMK